jgi:uncharacterized membrane protein YheB (UPF0754 family)
MNARFDTLEYVNTMEAAGIPRRHAEAIAKGLADLVGKDLVTQDFLRSELAVSRSEVASQIASLKAELRDEFRKEIGRLELQIRALQFGGAIAAFALGAVVLLTRLI